MFRFKQFTVHHDLCAMKVGTDGVLLGAWADVADAGRILDVGCGSGVIALMLAQRFPMAQIDAVEIDAAACEQAAANFADSPFARRLQVIHSDVRQYVPAQFYDSIVVNPPFFIRSLKSPDARRSTARHNDDLSFTDLLNHSRRLLVADGHLFLIVPFDAWESLQAAAVNEQFTLRRKTIVYAIENRPPKRLLLEYSLENSHQLPTEDRLNIQNADGAYSLSYRELTQAFYLKF